MSARCLWCGGEIPERSQRGQRQHRRFCCPAHKERGYIEAKRRGLESMEQAARIGSFCGILHSAGTSPREPITAMGETHG